MSHTPGPWRVEPSYESGPSGGELFAIGATYQWPEGDAAFCAIAFTPRIGVGPYASHRESDARLIAAAPGLLAALRDILEMIAADDLVPESVSYMREARAAVAKAEGR